MGIFSRLFKGGGDGESPDGEPPPPDLDGDAPVVEVIAGPALAESQPIPPAPLLPQFAAAGSAPLIATAAPTPVLAPPPPPKPKPRAQTSPGASGSIPKITAQKLRDPTMVMSPPPAPTPTPAPAPLAVAAPAAPAPAPAALGPAPIPRRAKSDSVSTAFDAVIDPTAVVAASAKPGVSTPADLAEVRRVFEQVAAVHVGQVRDVMLELRYGDAEPAWIEATRPALQSLRAMAAQMELTELCAALDAFCAAVETSVGGTARLGDDAKAELLARYQRLIELIPQAFELDAERDRREPIIVEALLYQVDGVERPTIDKLLAVGLGRLDVLLRANAGDLAAVSGIRHELATAIVEHFQAYRATASAAVSAPDPVAERRQLGDLLIILSLQNDDFRRAASSWTDDDRVRKRELRKVREQTFQRIKVALARLGEREQLVRLDKLAFDDRIASLDRYLSAQPPPRVTDRT